MASRWSAPLRPLILSWAFFWESALQTTTRILSNIANVIFTAMLVYDLLPIYVWAAFIIVAGIAVFDCLTEMGASYEL